MGAGSEVRLEPEVMIPAACGQVRSSGARCFSEPEYYMWGCDDSSY